MQTKLLLPVLLLPLFLWANPVLAQKNHETSVESCSVALARQIPDAALFDLADFCFCVSNPQNECLNDYSEILNALTPLPQACSSNSLSGSMEEVFPDLHNNRHLMQRTALVPEGKSSVSFNFESLNYLKNDEYFNDIANGETLFGYQFIPGISYQPTENVKISAGAYLQREFGNTRSSKVIPTYSIKVQKNDFSFIFGNLESSLNHQLSDPLYAYEKVITDRIEEGLQILMVKKNVFLDVWIDWENYLRPLEDDQETFSGGVSFIYRASDTQHITVSFPLQLVFLHNGGQVGVKKQPNTNFVNAAAGISFQLNIQDQGFFRFLRLEETYAAYTGEAKTFFDNSYNRGDGINSKLTLSTKFLDIRATHWRGTRFISIKGDEQYSSQSGNYEKKGFVEPHREFFTLSLQKNLQIAQGLVLALRFEPIWEFEQNKKSIQSPFHEVSYGCSLSYTLKDIHLAKVERLRKLK